MTRDQLIEYLTSELARLAAESSERPRVEGSFVASAPATGVTGLRLVAPDGTTLYLGVFEAEAFESDDATASPLLAAAQALLAARDSEMLTEDEWEGLARAASPPAPVPEGATQRFIYDHDHGLVRLIQQDGATILRQTAIPDALSAVAEFAEERAGPFMIEGARAADGFQFGRQDVEAACEFLVHLGLFERTLDGGYAPNGENIADKALAAMNALPAT